MEMMVFRSDRVFGKISAEYFASTGSFRELRRYVLEQLKCISVARKLNERNGWGITINGYSICASWNEVTHSVSKDTFIAKLTQMNRGLISDGMLKEIEGGCGTEWDEEEYFFSTQGHDFSELLALVCREYGNAKKNVSGEEIERNGRCAYSESDFAKSGLCRDLADYGESRGVRICAVEVDEQGGR